MDYFIAVTVPRNCTDSTLAGALQRACDAGAAGEFQVIDLTSAHRQVIFRRKSADDLEYVLERLTPFTIDVDQAAAKQLAAELTDASSDATLVDIVAALARGEAKVFEFGVAGLEQLRQAATAATA